MKKRVTLLYAFLLFVPTVLLGGAVSWLLWREQERFNEQLHAESLYRAQDIARNIETVVKTVQDELLDALSQIPEKDLVRELAGELENNPLVRNVFLWDPQRGLRFPNAAEGITDEEAAFIKRYDVLLSGRMPWPEALAESSTPGADPRQDGRQEGLSQRSSAQITQKYQSRLDLLNIAKLRSRRETAAYRRDSEAPARRGWTTWFWEDRMYLLGWYQAVPDSLMRGVELETMALLSRLLPEISAKEQAGMVYCLIDDAGRVVYQDGNGDVAAEHKALHKVLIGTALPHWQVAAFVMDNGVLVQQGRSFFLISGGLLLLFLAAIVLGGSSLLWLAHRNRRDAVQKTSFVSNVSHELKTPLTSIRMYAELLSEERIRDALKRKGYLGVIAAESRRLTRLVNNVLDFGRLEEGRKNYRLEDLDLADVVRSVTHAQQLRVEEAGIVLEETLPPDPVRVTADRDAVEQVVLNLLDNAIKYAAGNGTNVPAPGRSGEIAVCIHEHDGTAEVLVMDRGPGVPKAHRRRIFEMFHRVDNSLTASQQGCGLGLSIARRLLRDMGGDLQYRDRDGGGSIFAATFKKAK